MTKTLKIYLAALVVLSACLLELAPVRAAMPVGQSTDRGITTTRFGRYSSATQAKFDLKSPVLPNYDTLVRIGDGPTYDGQQLAADGAVVHIAGDETVTGRKTFVYPPNGVFGHISTATGSVSATTSNTLNVVAAGGSTVTATTVGGVPTLTITAGNNTPSVVTAADVGLGNVTNDAQVKRVEMGVANGVATLGSGGQLTTSQIPSSILGSVIYQGVWDASTNTPAITSGVGTKGWYRKVAHPGTTNIDGTSSWLVGDWIIYNGASWDRVQGNTADVLSVAGKTGVVVLGAADVQLANVPNVDATNAANIITGTLGADRIPVDGITITSSGGKISATGTGAVTGVTGTAPVVVSGRGALVVSMAAATNSTPGYLTAADHAGFLTSITTSTPTTLPVGALMQSSGSVVQPAAVTGSGSVALATNPTLTGPKDTVVNGGTCSSTYNVNPASGGIINLTISGACSITATSLSAGQSIVLNLTQSATTAPTFSSVFKWALGAPPTWSTAATKYDTLACESPDGVKLICGGLVDVR